MPDNVCKSCQLCNVPFSLFRRRHHCRICGKIFCYACSSNILDEQVTKFKFDGPIRACDNCAALAREDPNPKPLISQRPTCDGALANFYARAFVAAESSIQDDNVLRMLPFIIKAVTNVNPSKYVDKGIGLDVLSYVRVLEILPEAQVPFYVEGVVCNKNVLHKRMRRNVSNPKILLLSDNIISAASNTSMSSLDSVLERDKNSMEIIVRRIIKLQPDIVIVSKNISRDAQEAFEKHQSVIILIQNTMDSFLATVSMQTSSVVVQSVEALMMMTASSDVMGTCGNFSVKKYGGQTYLIFDECPNSLDAGGTVVVPSSANVIRNLIFSLYNYFYESQVFPDVVKKSPTLFSLDDDVINEVVNSLSM